MQINQPVVSKKKGCISQDAISYFNTIWLFLQTPLSLFLCFDFASILPYYIFYIPLSLSLALSLSSIQYDCCVRTTSVGPFLQRACLFKFKRFIPTTSTPRRFSSTTFDYSLERARPADVTAPDTPPMMLQVFTPVNWSNTFSKKPTRRMQTYVVEEGDTIAGIALRYGFLKLRQLIRNRALL